MKEESDDEETALVSKPKNQQQQASSCVKVMQTKMELEDEKTDILKGCDCPGDCDVCQSDDDKEKMTLISLPNEPETDQTEFYPQEWEVYKGAEECTSDDTTGNESHVYFEYDDAREVLPIIEQANSEPNKATVDGNDAGNESISTELKENQHEESKPLAISSSTMITLRRSTRTWARLVNYVEADTETETDSEMEKLYRPKSNLGSTHSTWCLTRKSLVCRQCGKRFACQRNATRHAVTVHQKRLQFVCSVAGCGKAFRDRHGLFRHSRTHPGVSLTVRAFRCTHCPSAFINKSALREHRKIHTGERPYACTDCGWAFIRKSHLKRHRRIRHG